MSELISIKGDTVDLDENEPRFFFDKQDYVDEHLALLRQIHGSYNSSDKKDVERMAGFARSYEWCEFQLQNLYNHISITKNNGAQISHWFNMRERANVQILHIKKDLGLDMKSRNPQTKGREADESLFTMDLKDRSIL